MFKTDQNLFLLLAGVGVHDVNSVHLAYRRNFTVPEEWKGQRLLLHFGAVDHQAAVYVNGYLLGSHSGG